MAPEDVSGPLEPISALQRSPAVKSSRCMSLSESRNAVLALLWAYPLPWSALGWDADLRGNELAQHGLKDRVVLSWG